MSLHPLNGRLAKLEAQSAPPARAAGTLYVWRLPHESDAEALARQDLDVSEWPQVRLRVWMGQGRVAEPPGPLWMPLEPPATVAWERVLTQCHEQLDARRRQWQEEHHCP